MVHAVSETFDGLLLSILSGSVPQGQPKYRVLLELVSKELNLFGVIAGLFRQIGGHSSRFVLFCSF